MFQIILQWNLLDANNIIADSKPSENLRGYTQATLLTSELLTQIKLNTINPLSVSDIADIKCKSRRDLYYKKGKNRPLGRRRSQHETWGGRAGPIVEGYFINYLSCRAKFSKKDYNFVAHAADRIHKDFLSEWGEDFIDLEALEGAPSLDTEWLKKLLNCGGRAELGLKVLHSMLKKHGSLNAPHIMPGISLEPNIDLGISSPATPDFIIPNHKIIGDVKSGGGFLPSHQLTCAGYALAYENANKAKKKHIDWGIIYFFPTKNYNVKVQPITFPQLYIFPIDDILRSYFLNVRDDAYQIISKDTPPDFPEDKSRCRSCKFFSLCEKDGLEL